MRSVLRTGDRRGSRTGSRYDWLICGTPTGLRARSLVGVNMGVNNQNGVDVQVISNLA